MRGIIAVSRDRYVARSDRDRMDWTGPEDKAVFRLLTSVGGELGASERTLRLMPEGLEGRRLHMLSRRPRMDLSGGDLLPHIRDLNWFDRSFNDPWLIGGQSLILEAIRLDLLSQLYVCWSGAECDPTPSAIPYVLDAYTIHGWARSMVQTFPAFMPGQVGVCVEVWNRRR